MAKVVRVGIDLTGIWRLPTGIFRYAIEVTKQLIQHLEVEPMLHYVLFFAREIHPDFLPFQSNFEVVLSPTRNELFTKQVWFPTVLPHLHLDVIHYPAFPPPYFQPSGPQTVMTFYDTGPWRYAQTQTLAGRIYFRTLLTKGAQTSAQILTLSKHARSEIGQILGNHYLPKIALAPGAVRADFALPVCDSSKQEVRMHYHLPAKYILTVATIEPRKNLPTLLDAYLQLKQQLTSICPPLVIVGRKGWDCKDILRYIQSLEEHVHFLGHLPDQDLIALYQSAACFVFPSLYEGFGLPVIEAMSAGCPVITTTSSSLPEVAGEAALLVDPLDAQGMARAMQKVLQDTLLRDQIIADGHRQAACFSWEQTARVHRATYLKVSLGQKTHISAKW